jgi:hypothetical protein
MEIKFDSFDGSLFKGILLFMAVTFYSIFNDSGINQDSVIHYNGRLKEAMTIKSQGGEMDYKFIDFKIIGRDDVFSLRKCAFLNLKLEETLNLKRGDELKVGVSPDSGSRKLEVVSLQSKQSILLLFDSYRSCTSNFFSAGLYIVFGLSFILVMRLILKVLKTKGVAFDFLKLKLGDKKEK